MSYPVRVVVRETVREVVATADELRLSLGEDPVIAKPAVREKLRARLAEAGWTSVAADPGTMRRTLEDGTEVVWELEANALSIRADAKSTVEEAGQLELTGDSMTREGAERQRGELRSQGKGKLIDQLRAKLDAAKDAEERALLERIHRKLERAHDQIREEINVHLEAVYRDWLLEQAKSLGNVVGQSESVSPDGDIYELTIKIAT